MGSTKRKATRQSKDLPILPLPVRCAGEGCGAWSILAVPGDPPFRAAWFDDVGWKSLNDPRDGSIIFVCPNCYEKGQAGRVEQTMVAAVKPH